MGLKPLHPLPSPRPAVAKRLPPRAGMNKTEARYAAHLDLLIHTGKILGWGYQRIKLRLADNTQYIPDFDVQMADATLEFHEVKGHWEDDARVKIKVAAEQYPHFTFIACRRLKKGETARAQLDGLAGFEAETFASRRA